jgi:hypothetical protein
MGEKGKVIGSRQAWKNGNNMLALTGKRHRD